MEGYIQIKRKLFWVYRYAEIKDQYLNYYENKGDSKMRGTYYLPTCDGRFHIEVDGQRKIDVK